MRKSLLLLQTLEMLRTKPGSTMEELKAGLGRSERTVYRYLADLASELDVPVCYEEGTYRLAQRSDLTNLSSLTEEEALAVHVALSSTAMSGSSPFGPAAQSALGKIEASLRNLTYDQLQKAQHKHLLAPSVFSDNVISEDVAAAIRDGVNGNRRLLVCYRSQKSGVEELLVDPYGIAFRRHNWYVVAYSHKHDRIIQLKMARMLKVSHTEDTFKPPEHFSLQAFYEKSWEVWTGEEEVTVRIRFSPRVAPLIRESWYHPSQTVEDLATGGLILGVTVAGTHEIGPWILGYGGDAEVLEPEHLRDQLMCAAREIQRVYDPSLADLPPDTNCSGAREPA